MFSLMCHCSLIYIRISYSLSSFGFYLVFHRPKLIFLKQNLYPNYWKCLFIKFLEKFQKNYTKILYIKCDTERPGAAQGGSQSLHTMGRRGPLQAAPGPGVGPPWPSTYLPHSHTPAHTRRTPPTCSKHEFLLLVFPIFDLFAQPPICSEIWSICSLVFDSPVHPSRILSSGVHLEYFAAVGDMLCELACLIYA